MVPLSLNQIMSLAEVIDYLNTYPFTTPDSNWGEVWNLIQLELCRYQAGGC